MITMEHIRSIVRPLLTLSGWAVALYLAINIEVVRDRIIDAVLMMVAFWFGQRGNKDK